MTDTDRNKLLKAYRAVRVQLDELSKQKTLLEKQIKSREDFDAVQVDNNKITRVVTHRYSLRDDIDQDVIIKNHPEAVEQSLDLAKLQEEKEAIMQLYPEAVVQSINVSALKEIADAHQYLQEKQTVSVRFSEVKEKE